MTINPQERVRNSYSNTSAAKSWLLIILSTLMGNLPLWFLFLFSRFSLRTTGSSSYHQNLSTDLCLGSERAALLKFIQGFNPSPRLTSWTPERDCCKWEGVTCNNETGHVSVLDLHGHSSADNFQGELRDSLLDLPYLTRLDLSLNDFRQVQVPGFLGSLKHLEYLNLSYAKLRGKIPEQLGNLSKLKALDLGGNDYNLRVDTLDWLLGFSNLQILDLSGVDLSNVVNWLRTVNSLSSLKTLSLSVCEISHLPALGPSPNLTSLETLDLSLNHFNSPIPDWLLNMSTNLVHLSISSSQLGGRIPEIFGNLRTLTTLDLSENNLTGYFPELKGLSSLKELRLSNNQLKGPFLHRIANLSQLVVLNVSSNLLEDIFSEKLLNFSHLRVLDLSSNRKIVLNMSAFWLPHFQLDVIKLQSCRLGRKFPRWLGTQKEFSYIDISSAGISDTIPNWFWNLSVNMEKMDLSDNQLRGKVPDFSSKLQLSVLDLSSNMFSGSLPHISPNLMFLSLAENSFSGPITSLCQSLVANNSLRRLDLSYNNFSGPFPDCWTYGEKLDILNLAFNTLSGQIPSSIRHLTDLKVLKLDRNHLSGELPSSLKYLTNLVFLDLSDNMLSGKLSPWIGESFQNLMFLIFSQNKLSGEIPIQLCQLKHLVILDLGRNSLSGTIPRCIDNFLTLAMIDDEQLFAYYANVDYWTYLRAVWVWCPNRKIINILTVFDLSTNQLSGEIPGELTSLIGLQFLNLSGNNLSGPIPSGIGAMKELESLDLSNNQLSCSIPHGMVKLSFLSYLNLSYNNLSGKIPNRGQFQIFDNSSYINNQNLCGSPLNQSCLGKSYTDPRCEVKNQPNIEFQEKDHSEALPSFYISMGIGFIAAIWICFTVLLLNPSLREAYSEFLDKVVERICVTGAVNGARTRRRLHK